MKNKTFLISLSDRTVLFTSRLVTIEAENAKEAVKKAKMEYPSCNVTLIEEQNNEEVT